jgi:hypothetical protein
MLFAMAIVPSLPLFVTLLFRGMPGIGKSRHCFMLGWLIGMQALLPGRKTLVDLAFPSHAQSCLLGGPSVRGMVGV